MRPRHIERQEKLIQKTVLTLGFNLFEVIENLCGTPKISGAWRYSKSHLNDKELWFSLQVGALLVVELLENALQLVGLSLDGINPAV